MEAVPPVRLESRHVGTIETDDDVTIRVSHLYSLDLQPCPSSDCPEKEHLDPSLVELLVTRHGEDTCESVLTMLQPEVGLLLAERIGRAAQLVLASSEGVASPEREMRRLAEAVMQAREL